MATGRGGGGSRKLDFSSRSGKSQGILQIGQGNFKYLESHGISLLADGGHPVIFPGMFVPILKTSTVSNHKYLVEFRYRNFCKNSENNVNSAHLKLTNGQVLGYLVKMGQGLGMI